MNYYKIREMLEAELRDYSARGNLSNEALDHIHKLTDTIKNIDKIEMLEEKNGFSHNKEEMLEKMEEMLKFFKER